MRPLLPTTEAPIPFLALAFYSAMWGAKAVTGKRNTSVEVGMLRTD